MSLEPTKSIDELMQEAHALVADGHFKEAEMILLDVLKSGDKKRSLECFHTLETLAKNRGDLEEAIRYALSNIAANKELYGDDSDQVVSSMVRLAEIYEQAGKDEEANDLHYRAKVISDKLVFDEPKEEVVDESQVGSAEQAEEFRSTLKYYAKQKEDADDGSQSAPAKSDAELEKDPDDLDFVFADDEPKEQKSGWLVDSINKANAKRNQPEPSAGSTKPRSKGEITEPHKFRTEDPKEEHNSTTRRDHNANDQSESRTNAATIKEHLNNDSHLRALAHGKEEIARSLNIGNIKWTFQEFVKKRSNIVAVGIASAVFFVVLLVAAYLQPRKVTPLDAYVSMPHAYKSLGGDTRINLASQEISQITQGDAAITLPTSYVVDWRSHLEVLVRSFFEKQIWLRKSTVALNGAVDKSIGDSLVSDEGNVYYTLHNPDLLLGDRMQEITANANAYYLDHNRYPSESSLPNYQNVFTRSASKPRLKRLEFLATDTNDVLRQIEKWKADLVNSKDLKPGVIDTFELLVSYPKGKMELFAVRSSKLDRKPQLVVSANGDVSENKNSFLIPSGNQLRPRRVWIESQDSNDIDSFFLHHASLMFSLFLSVVVGGSYAFLNLQGAARRGRFRLLFISLLMLAVYAAGTAFTF